MEISIRGGYSSLWKAIIRPPRHKYHLEDLGPQKFILDDKEY
jgi:hypothetical protein